MARKKTEVKELPERLVVRRVSNGYIIATSDYEYAVGNFVATDLYELSNVLFDLFETGEVE